MKELFKLIGSSCEISIFNNVKGRFLRFEISKLGTLAEIRYVTGDNMIIEEWFFLDELKY